MLTGIKNGWKKVPSGVKTGLFVVGCLAAGAAIKVGVNKAYNEYHKEDEPVIDNGGVVLEDVAVVVSDDAQEVVVSND